VQDGTPVAVDVFVRVRVDDAKLKFFKTF
jgi:hypothetical protein